MPESYDAVVVVSFGGPEGPDDVLPFLENVLRGRDVPRERMLEVAEHYQRFGGVSPLNEQIRQLIVALRAELDSSGPKLPIFWGNRNWRPLLQDTLQEMADAGVRRAIAYVTSAFSSYSSCRQYLENVEAARREVGPRAPQVDKLRAFFNHPGFIGASVERTEAAFRQLPAERRATAGLVFTAHSIPLAMAESCRYVEQLQEASRLVAEQIGATGWRLAYQSRSGPPAQPWLEPDLANMLAELAAEGKRDVVVAPIGFLSDHVEVICDLDVAAQQVCQRLGMFMVRAATVGQHPKFVRMIRDLIVERMTGQPDRPALGQLGPSHDICPPDCCPYVRRASPQSESP